MTPESPSVRRDEESGEEKRETSDEEVYEVSGDQIRFDSTTVGESKSERVEPLSSSSL